MEENVTSFYLVTLIVIVLSLQRACTDLDEIADTAIICKISSQSALFVNKSEIQLMRGSRKFCQRGSNFERGSNFDVFFSFF